jgi:two-component system, NtrC family, sensor kinase
MARILVVEDDRDLRELLADVLVVEGHEVFKAADGAHGLKVLLDKTPKLLLTDVVMPQMDGIELLRVVKELGSARSGLKIIAISGASDQSKFLEAAAAMGANKILSKPFTRTDILQAVEEVLASRAEST